MATFARTGALGIHVLANGMPGTAKAPSGRKIQELALMIILRRFLLITVLGFWQGGFALYAAIVVPVGQEVLGSHLQQGFVTRRVTNYLNLAGSFAAVVTLWELFAARWQSVLPGLRVLARLRALTWLGMFLALTLQVWLHQRLDQMLDVVTMDVLDHTRFYAEHRWYLLISALQLLCCLSFVVATLFEWRSRDRDLTFLQSGLSVKGGRDS